MPASTVSLVLTELGWQSRNGSAVPPYVVSRLPAATVLANVAAEPDDVDRSVVSPEAATLARAALRRGRP